MKEIIGMVSGAFVIASIIPYAIRAYQKKTKPNLVSWSIWSILGLALLLTYKSSGAKDNIWPAVFGFTNPILLTIILIWRGKIEKPNMLEIICAVIGIVSIILWYFLQESKEYVQYALYLAIFADACAAIPTVLAYFKNPDEDRPFAWLLFGMGWILAIFAVPEDTIANYALPAYMAIASLLITLPLIVYRIKNKVKITEWI